MTNPAAPPSNKPGSPPANTPAAQAGGAPNPSSGSPSPPSEGKGGQNVKKPSPRAEYYSKSNDFIKLYLELVYGAQLDGLVSDDSTEQKLKTIVTILQKSKRLEAVFEAAYATLKGDPEATLDTKVRLFGAQNCVELLVVHKLAGARPLKGLSMDGKSGKLKRPIREILRFSRKTYAQFDEQNRYQNGAFAAALVFDILALLILEETDPDAKRLLSRALDTAYARGMATAGLAIEMGRKCKRLALEKHLLPVILLNEAGRIAFNLIYKDYSMLIKEFDIKSVPQSLRPLYETRRYGGNSSFFDAMLSWSFSMFDGLTEVLMNVDTPYLLKGTVPEDEFDLASACFLTKLLYRNQSYFSKMKNSVAAKSLRPELADVDITIDASIFPSNQSKE